MSIFNVIRLLLLLFAFIVTVLALPADPVVAAPAVAVPTPTSLAPLYVVKTGRLAVSGCSNEDIAELTSAYSEAIQMMAKAQNVLNGGQVPWADAKDRALWARQSLLLYELFRIVIDPDTGAVVPPGPDVDVELNDAAALGTVTGKSIRRFLRLAGAGFSGALSAITSKLTRRSATVRALGRPRRPSGRSRTWGARSPTSWRASSTSGRATTARAARSRRRPAARPMSARPPSG